MYAVNGYSKRSLVEKLGIKQGSKVRIVNPPANYIDILGSLPRGVVLSDKLEEFDFIQFFTVSMLELKRKFPVLKKRLSKGGMLWISWPKRSSKLSTELDENAVRDVGLENGMVDVKVCAVDKDWSGLKFVYRLKDCK